MEWRREKVGLRIKNEFPQYNINMAHDVVISLEQE
jgi:hypothetical protein